MKAFLVEKEKSQTLKLDYETDQSLTEKLSSILSRVRFNGRGS